MENLSEDDLTIKDNSTEVSGAASLSDYKTAVILNQIWPPCILLLGGFGNVATFFVMRRIKDHNSSQYAILTALAVSDFLLLYCGALRDWVRHVLGTDIRNVHTWACRLHKFMMYLVSTTSAWLLTCVTVQRTMAVLWPHRMRTVWTVRRTWMVIAGLVSTAVVIHSHFLLWMEVSSQRRCDAVSGVYQFFYRSILSWVDMTHSSILPCLCQFLCDVILSVMLFKTASASTTIAVYVTSTANNEHKSGGGGGRRKTASRTTLMVLMLSFTFFALSLPVYIFYTLWYLDVDVYIQQTPEVLASMKLGSTVAHLLWYTNGAVNFFLYCLTGTKYRQEFLRWILCRDGAAQPGSSAERSREKNSTQLSHQPCNFNSQDIARFKPTTSWTHRVEVERS